MNIKTWDSILIFLAGFILFSIGQNHEIIGFESRFYLFALEMWKNGPSWFPTTYYLPYPDYPGTSTFIIYLLSKLSGGVSRFIAILPTIFAASITLVFTYLIGALYNRKWGLGSVFVLLLTYAFVSEARTISLDLFITAITTILFYVLLSSSFAEKSSYLVWIFPLLILGFLFRGPMGLVIPTAVMSIYFLLEKNFKRFFFFGLMAAVLLILCTSCLLLIAQKMGGPALLHDVLQKEVLGRMQEGGKVPPHFFYFIEAFVVYAIAYPFAVLIAFRIIFDLNYSDATQLLKKLLGWALVILIGLSIPVDKKIRYILPAAPAGALICGYLFIIAREKQYLFFIKKLFLSICFLLPWVGAAILIALHYKYPEFKLAYRTGLVLLSLLVIVMILVHKRDLFVLGAAVLSFFVMLILIVEPINLDLNKSQDFVMQVEKIRNDEKADLAFYHQGRDRWVIKYIAQMPEQSIPVFLKTETDLKNLKKGILVISSDQHYQQLSKKTLKHFRLLLEGRLGREPVVVLVSK